MNKHRIDLLDGFRFIAIMAVVLYHFTNESAAIYPYGNFFRHIFSWGYLGVQFFFMISGFVISYTLENTAGLLSFYRNRFGRLFPAMLLCTLLTFIVCSLLDNNNLFRNAHDIKNFAPSLTFTNPSIFTFITKIDFHWINGSYWSLWVEIQFYIIASMVYYLNRKHFFRNMLLAGIAISLLTYIPDLLTNYIPYLASPKRNGVFAGWKYGNEVFNITFFILWFLPGVVFYQLYKGLRLSQNIFPAILTAVMLFCLVRSIRNYNPDFFAMVLGSFIMFVLFLLMIYQKKYLSFLQKPFFTRIGLISYSIYLIHEDIGILLINKYGKYLGDFSPLSPFIVIGIVTCFAELSYRFYEKRAGVFLKRMFGKRRVAIHKATVSHP